MSAAGVALTAWQLGGATALLWALAVALAWWRRSRFFAAFVGVVFSIPCLVWLPLSAGRGEPFRWLLAAGLLLASVHFIRLSRPRLRSWPLRTFVSIPGLAFVAACFLGVPWALAGVVGFALPAVWLPFLLTALGVIQSLRYRVRRSRLVIDGQRLPYGPLQEPKITDASAAGALRVVQLTDPHMGPFMSPGRLRKICERVVAEQPDLVLVTGDLLTMESQSAPEVVAWSLAPLQQLSGKVFACLGNHDLEALPTVRRAYDDCGARLLVDELERVETRIGDVEIVGLDEMWKRGRAPLETLAVLERFPEPIARLVMLHNPFYFDRLPKSLAPRLVLAGHTHGGQLGLVSLGLRWTTLRVLARGRPDIGLWANGLDRLFVSSGVGHYGFPIRLGVPAELNVLEIEWSAGS